MWTSEMVKYGPVKSDISLIPMWSIKGESHLVTSVPVQTTTPVDSKDNKVLAEIRYFFYNFV